MTYQREEPINPGDLELPDVEDYTFSDWIDSTAALQIVAYGQDPAALTRYLQPVEGEELQMMLDPIEGADFVRWNLFAAMVEIGEAANECGWKPWATDRTVNREAFLIEIVDCMHFLGNLLRLVQVEGPELTQAYRKKQLKNLQRQIDGYDGKSEKCTYCHRDLSEVPSHLIYQGVGGEKYCSETHWRQIHPG